MSLDAWHARYSCSPLGSILFVQSFRFTVDETPHGFIIAAVIEVIVSPKASHTSSAARTATWPLVMSRQSIASGELATTFFADVRPFPCVQFRMPFQVVETAKARLTGRAHIRLFLTMGE